MRRWKALSESAKFESRPFNALALWFGTQINCNTELEILHPPVHSLPTLHHLSPPYPPPWVTVSKVMRPPHARVYHILIYDIHHHCQPGSGWFSSKNPFRVCFPQPHLMSVVTDQVLWKTDFEVEISNQLVYGWVTWLNRGRKQNWEEKEVGLRCPAAEVWVSPQRTWEWD